MRADDAARSRERETLIEAATAAWRLRDASGGCRSACPPGRAPSSSGSAGATAASR